MDHGDTCYLNPDHHVCAVARAARAEGALARVQAAAGAEATVARVTALYEEFVHDLELRGDDWHPRARNMAEQVVAQLGAALGVDGGD